MRTTGARFVAFTCAERALGLATVRDAPAARRRHALPLTVPRRRSLPRRMKAPAKTPAPAPAAGVAKTLRARGGRAGGGDARAREAGAPREPPLHGGARRDADRSLCADRSAAGHGLHPEGGAFLRGDRRAGAEPMPGPRRRCGCRPSIWTSTRSPYEEYERLQEGSRPIPPLSRASRGPSYFRFRSPQDADQRAQLVRRPDVLPGFQGKDLPTDAQWEKAARGHRGREVSLGRRSRSACERAIIKRPQARARAAGRRRRRAPSPRPDGPGTWARVRPGSTGSTT